MKDIFKFYTDDWTVLKKESIEYSKYPKLKKNDPLLIDTKKNPQRFEMDLEGQFHSRTINLKIHFKILLFFLKKIQVMVNLEIQVQKLFFKKKMKEIASNHQKLMIDYPISWKNPTMFFSILFSFSQKNNQ